MCNPFGGGGGGIDADAVARQAEERRAQRVRQGTASINTQFEGFTPGFFQGIEQDALDFFNPQLQSQFSDTREGLIKNLARAGNLDGSVGARNLGELTEELATQQGFVADKARNFGQGARADVESNRANLIQNLAASADPFAAAQAAAASASSLTAPPEFSPLGDVFTKFANLATPQIVAAQRGFDNPASILFNNQRGSATNVA